MPRAGCLSFPVPVAGCHNVRIWTTGLSGPATLKSVFEKFSHLGVAHPEPQSNRATVRHAAHDRIRLISMKSPPGKETGELTWGAERLAKSWWLFARVV